MINGFLSTMSLWDPLMLDELAKQHQLILFDNRGAGLSTDTPQNHTTIQQMADDAAGLARSLGTSKVNVLAYSMGARIGQQLLIRHPDLVAKAVLAAADPGGRHHLPAAADVESRLNDPRTPEIDKIALTFTNDEAGRQAARAVVARLKAAVEAGTIPNDFKIPRQTIDGRTVPAPCSGGATTATSRPSPPSGFRFSSPTAAPTPSIRRRTPC